LTYGALHGASRNVSINLPPLLGLRPGDVVGLVLPNCPEYPIAFYGCLAAGLVVSPANPLYTPGKIFQISRVVKVSN
jgi:long-chain acyl-CoA synthetase